MKNSEIIKLIELFNEKAEKLVRLSFIETMFKYNSGVTIKINKRDDGFYDLEQERRGPREEAIDAFILTIRFFIQDNESISLRRLAKIYEMAPIEKKLKAKFILLKNQINEYLNSNSFIVININNKEEMLTHRKILDTIIYGGLSHANKKKKIEYDIWMKTPPLKAIIENDFVYSLAILYEDIKSICDLNKIIIKTLESS
jgi:hypothetical protein